MLIDLVAARHFEGGDELTPIVAVGDTGSVKNAPVSRPVGGRPHVTLMDLEIPLDVLVLDAHNAAFSAIIKRNCEIPLISHLDGNVQNCAYNNMTWERLADCSRAREARAVCRLLYLNWELGEACASPPGRRAQNMAGSVSD